MSLVTRIGDDQAIPFVVNDSVVNASAKWKGGEGTFTAHAGTWGGGSVKLQVLLPDGSTYADVGTDTSLTADGGGQFALHRGATIRALVTTATGVYASAGSLR